MAKMLEKVWVTDDGKAFETHTNAEEYEKAQLVERTKGQMIDAMASALGGYGDTFCVSAGPRIRIPFTRTRIGFMRPKRMIEIGCDSDDYWKSLQRIAKGIENRIHWYWNK